MNRWIYTLMAAALVVVVGVSSCCDSQGRQPKAGDTVTPVLNGTPSWKAGQEASLGVRLQAKGKDDASPRSLDFITGVSANPVATITFYKGDEALSTPTEATFSHRC